MAETETSTRDSQAATASGEQSQEINQEMVSKVADRVLAMLLTELNIERERLHRSEPARRHILGGWR